MLESGTLESLEDRTTPATLPTGFTEAAVATGLASATAMECCQNERMSSRCSGIPRNICTTQVASAS